MYDNSTSIKRKEKYSMNTQNYLQYIVDEIHSTIVATVDDDGLPVTCAIDMMDWDSNSLYFLTAKGKSFYTRLKQKEFLALTGMKGEDTMTSVAVSVRGKVREIGSVKLPDLFEKNPYMGEIYPDEKSRSALTVFQIYEGSGELFDLSQKPIFRQNFSFGGAKTEETGYFVDETCIGCKQCYSVCPQRCIDITVKPVVIQSQHCLHCGKCAEICPVGAVARIGGRQL